MKKFRSHKKDKIIPGLGRVRVYDKPSVCDRYTAVYLDQGSRGSVPYLGMSEHPFLPLGIGMHGELLQIGSFLGKIISFDSLPDQCQKAIQNDGEIS